MERRSEAEGGGGGLGKARAENSAAAAIQRAVQRGADGTRLRGEKARTAGLVRPAKSESIIRQEICQEIKDIKG